MIPKFYLNLSIFGSIRNCNLRNDSHIASTIASSLQIIQLSSDSEYPCRLLLNSCVAVTRSDHSVAQLRVVTILWHNYA